MPRTVLVIDDDEGTRDLLRLFLEYDGFDVVTASEGGEALALLAGGLPPALITLGLVMPGMDGWAFHAALRADPRLDGVPVILVSGTCPLPRIAAELGVAGYLEKPFTGDELLATVRRHARA